MASIVNLSLRTTSAPNEFQCCISYEIMVDPVIAEDGHSYEKKEIERWFREHHRSPKTNQPIGTTLTENHALRNVIQDWQRAKQAHESSAGALAGRLCNASTKEKALDYIGRISELIETSDAVDEVMLSICTKATVFDDTILADGVQDALATLVAQCEMKMVQQRQEQREAAEKWERERPEREKREKAEREQAEKELKEKAEQAEKELKEYKEAVAERLNLTVEEIVFVLPGRDSVKNGCEKAVQKELNNIHLLEGTHIVTSYKDEDGDDMPYVLFEVPMTVSGDGREKTFVEGGGFRIEGEKDQYCTFFDLTIQKTKRRGLNGNRGMSFDCRRVKFDKCGRYGVFAWKTKGRLTNCQVTNCKYSGIVSSDDSTIEIEGEESRINNNCTSGESGDYGLFARSSSIIHLLSPLTKEDVSTNNNGSGNYGGGGTIETVNSF